MPTNTNDAIRTFGHWLANERAARGWSQGDVASHADSDLTQGYVSSLERGVRRPSREMVRTIAKALFAGDPVDYIRFEARALDAAGFRSHALPDSWEDWPDPLKRALSYTGTLSRESQEYVYQLWMKQAEAHAAIADEHRRLVEEVEKMRREKDGKSG